MQLEETSEKIEHIRGFLKRKEVEKTNLEAEFKVLRKEAERVAAIERNIGIKLLNARRHALLELKQTAIETSRNTIAGILGSAGYEQYKGTKAELIKELNAVGSTSNFKRFTTCTNVSFSSSKSLASLSRFLHNKIRPARKWINSKPRFPASRAKWRVCRIRSTASRADGFWWNLNRLNVKRSSMKESRLFVWKVGISRFTSTGPVGLVEPSGFADALASEINKAEAGLKVFLVSVNRRRTVNLHFVIGWKGCCKRGVKQEENWHRGTDRHSYKHWQDEACRMLQVEGSNQPSWDGN